MIIRTFLALFVAFITVLPSTLYVAGSTAGSEPLYEFQGFALVLDEGFAPVVVDFEKVGGVCDLRVVSAESLLQGLSGSDLYARLAEVLGDAKYVVFEAVCGRSVGEGVSAFRDGPGYVVSIPAGPCLVRGVPLFLRVSGSVFVDRGPGGGVRVRAAMKLSPALDPSIYRPILERGLKWLGGLFTGGAVEGYAEFTIIDGSVYQGSEYIGFGFTPLYIAYPRNVSEIEEASRSPGKVNYLGMRVNVTLETFRLFTAYLLNGTYVGVRREVYAVGGNATLWRNLLNRLIYAEAVTTCFRPTSLDVPEESPALARFAAKILLGQKSALNYSETRTIVEPFSVYPEKPSISAADFIDVSYWSAYPVKIFSAPVKVRVRLSGEERYIYLLLLDVDVKYSNFDPYSVDIGVKREEIVVEPWYTAWIDGVLKILQTPEDLTVLLVIAAIIAVHIFLGGERREEVPAPGAPYPV